MLRQTSVDYGFVAASLSEPAEPLELCLSEVLLEASKRGASTRPLTEPVFPLRPELEGLVVLPHVAAAVTFARSMGVEHFSASLENVPHQSAPCVVLRGRGFRVMALQGRLADVPSDIAKS